MFNKLKSKTEIMSLGLDERKSELVEFLIKNENLNQFAETDNFFYWFNCKETTLSSHYKFLQVDSNNRYVYKYKNKEYDLNSFDGISQLVVDVKLFDELNSFFSPNLNFDKIEYFLRYSKKYNKLEYYFNHHYLQSTKNKKHLIVRHKKIKFFTVKENNYVLYYRSINSPRYISNKNAMFLRPLVSFNYCHENINLSWDSHEKYLSKMNILLLSIHQKNKVFNERNFYDNLILLDHVPNKFMLNIKSLDEVLLKFTKKRPVPKILTSKFSTSELILLYSLVEYEQVDKIIKFIYENIEFYQNVKSDKTMVQENYILNIIKDYLHMRLNMKIKSKENNELIWVDSRNAHYVEDYIRLAKSQKSKLNLNIKSIKRIIEEHDNFVRNLDIKSIPEIKVDKKYPDIKSDEIFEVEKIQSKERLILESDLQKHCVKTYSSIINSGNCCIYSFLDKRTKLRWTLEVRKIKKNNSLLFYIQQLKGKFNSSPDSDLAKEILKKLIGNKITTKFLLDKNDFTNLDCDKFLNQELALDFTRQDLPF